MSTTTNPIVGTGRYSHEVPVVPGVVVLIRDAHHAGTAIWRREDERDYVFASYDTRDLQVADRCLLVRGLLPDELDQPYGCDLDSPDGLVLVGVDKDDRLDWVPDDAEVLWDSADSPGEG